MSTTHTPTELLADLATQGVELAVVDGHLSYKGPSNVLTPQILSELRLNKPHLLRLKL